MIKKKRASLIDAFQLRNLISLKPDSAVFTCNYTGEEDTQGVSEDSEAHNFSREKTYILKALRSCSVNQFEIFAN